MKKVIAALFAVFFVGTTLAIAAPAKSAGKIKNTQIVQANQDLNLSYLGTPISVPAGQVLILGERPNGSIVIRGLNMDQIQVGPGTFSTEGYSIVSYQPKTNVIFLNRGKWLTLRDPHGQTATVQEKGAILATNAKINSNTLEDLRIAGQNDADEAVADLQNKATKNEKTAPNNSNGNEGNAFPSSEESNVLDSVAHQQASNDVEATLSPSAPTQDSSNSNNPTTSGN